MAKVGDNEYPGYSMVASGLAAVWAGENTRASIFDAMKRKETYATTGSRIIVRFFGGWDFDAGDAANRLPARVGYEKGVPMGGNLAAMPEGKRAPTFLVAAMKDPMGGNLDRIQIVKGWLDGEGRSHEKVYDVAWSDERKPDPESGKLPPVGNTVDVANATWTNSLLRGSFVPPAQMRQLRLVSRQRQKLVGQCSAEKNRLHKILTDAGIRLNVVVSDIHGQAARAMIKSLIDGRPLHEVLDRKGRLRASREELLEALNTDEFSAVHRFVAAEILEHIEQLEQRIARMDRYLLDALKDHGPLLDLLETIPGVDRRGAAMLLVEIGTEMSVFGRPSPWGWTGTTACCAAAWRRSSSSSLRISAPGPNPPSPSCRSGWMITRRISGFRPASISNRST